MIFLGQLILEAPLLPLLLVACFTLSAERLARNTWFLPKKADFLVGFSVKCKLLGLLAPFLFLLQLSCSVNEMFCRWSHASNKKGDVMFPVPIHYLSVAQTLQAPSTSEAIQNDVGRAWLPAGCGCPWISTSPCYTSCSLNYSHLCKQKKSMHLKSPTLVTES